jgi:hypothetical protein
MVPSATLAPGSLSFEGWIERTPPILTHVLVREDSRRW